MTALRMRVGRDLHRLYSIYRFFHSDFGIGNGIDLG